jgi:hypothetical protein
MCDSFKFVADTSFSCPVFSSSSESNKSRQAHLRVLLYPWTVDDVITDPIQTKKLPTSLLPTWYTRQDLSPPYHSLSHHVLLLHLKLRAYNLRPLPVPTTPLSTKPSVSHSPTLPTSKHLLFWLATRLQLNHQTAPDTHTYHLEFPTQQPSTPQWPLRRPNNGD